MLPYKAIEILTNEAARYRNRPLVDAVVQFVSQLKIAARCIVTRGISGCYENGELATGRLEILSLNMPIRITIVLPAAETERVVSELNGMIQDGIVMLHDLTVFGYKTRNPFFPRQLMVRDVMTTSPESVSTTTSLSDVVNLLLPSVFTGVPVVDERRCPVGVVTQGDLIRKGGLPMRLGLLAESDDHGLNAVLDRLKSRKTAEVMTTPAVVIAEDRALTEAVDWMLSKNVKRLPVVDGKGRLSGMLSRLDIFRTVMREAPDWKAFRSQKIEVNNVKRVGDILRRDTRSVAPDTPIDQVIQLIDGNDIQRVAVVDPEGTLLGVISDRDLLQFFTSGPSGIWQRLASVKNVFRKGRGRASEPGTLAETTAGTVMTTALVTVQEETVIEEAIALMTEKGLKRLPVVDATGHFKGMVSRASLLRTGFGASA